ncbi:phosphoesterase family-domain-containing protein [Triangularia verruculosa]|uniref:Phosphoesterase family-domain-containing protein n=1 Tax=Triangularia verruculosa TaxID=2587418 RepID=A0AAN7AT64_9PEZI|nr:phosphoesterase family-domain-containing protein [Triangularia verruculosa]
MIATPFTVALLGFLGSAAAQTQYTSTHTAAVAAARATALTLSPTSNVAGRTFDRFVQIWLENIDYIDAIADPNLAWLATQGISLTNYIARTHPSQPNYIAVAGGTRHGITDNNVHRLDASIKSVVDILDAGGISWSIYQEDMPYSGFQGPSYAGGSYVRKHNPLASFDSVTGSVTRSAKCKNFTMFEQDLANNKLPQWMFLTPNMDNSGHDTSVSYAGRWARNFITPLLSDSKFNIPRTLVMLTFDEGSYNRNNQVYAVLLGSAVPSNKKGTTNSTSYGHYSVLKTVELNWNLGNLGQNDVGANAFF